MGGRTAPALPMWPDQGRAQPAGPSVWMSMYASMRGPTLRAVPGHAAPDMWGLESGRISLLFSPLQVPEIIQYIYHNMSSITEPTAQETIRKVLHLLAQSHTEDVILTLFRMQDQSQRWVALQTPD